MKEREDAQAAEAVAAEAPKARDPNELPPAYISYNIRAFSKIRPN